MFYKNLYKKKLIKIEGLSRRLIKLRDRQAQEEQEANMLPPYVSKQQMKDITWSYEALRRQAAYQSQAAYVKQYYRDIYEECLLVGAKIYWPMN